MAAYLQHVCTMHPVMVRVVLVRVLDAGQEVGEALEVEVQAGRDLGVDGEDVEGEGGQSVTIR